MLRPSPHFGVVPKVMAAACAGYVLGRLSSLRLYDERLRSLPPNSYLGNTLRKYHAENNPSSAPNPVKK